MKIALIAPYSNGPGRGNITTVNRIARFLLQAGCDAAIFPIDSCSSSELRARVQRFAPTVVHGFHAGICGDTACRLADERAVPCVITMTGSDIYDAAQRCRPETSGAMACAAAVVCFDNLIAAEVGSRFPGLSGRLRVIPQGVEQLPVQPESRLVVPEDAFVVLFPAALRPVKNLECALDAMPDLLRKLPDSLLLVAGGTIDPEYAGRVMDRITVTAGVIALGDVPRDRMGGLYARADLVLNCSRFEGGMANSLLEAMSLGRPVLAADIQGNRALVHDGETGWLYSAEAEFREKLVWLAGQPQLRRRVGEMARLAVAERFRPELEARRHIDLYESVCCRGGY